MQITRQQRINNVSSQMIEGLRETCEKYRSFLKEGLKLPAGNPPGFPAFTCTGEEIGDALGDNLKPMETVLEYVLDGKSNQITKGKRKSVR